MKVLRTIAVVVGVHIFWFLVSVLVGRREANFFLMIIASIILPVMHWRHRPLTWTALVLSVIAFAIALSPIDLTVQPGMREIISVKPVSYGLVCKPDTVCYGCIHWPSDPAYAVVISF